MALARRKRSYKARRKYKGTRKLTVYRNTLGISRRHQFMWKHTFSYFDARAHALSATALVTTPLRIDISNIYNPLGLSQPTSTDSCIQSVTEFVSHTSEPSATYRPCIDHDDVARFFKSYMVDSCVVVAKFVVPELSTTAGQKIQAIGARLIPATYTQQMTTATLADFIRQYGAFKMYDVDSSKQAVLKRKFVPYRGSTVGKAERTERLKSFFDATSNVPNISSDAACLVFYTPPPTQAYAGGTKMQLTIELYYNVFLEDPIHTEDAEFKIPL